MERPEPRWGRPGCWRTYGCAVTAACFTTFLIISFLLAPVFIPKTNSTAALYRPKRFAHHHAHLWMDEDPKDLTDTNLWYSYAKMLAIQHNQTNCYVCSVIPKSSLQPDLYATPMTKDLARLTAGLTGIGCARNSSGDSAYEHLLLTVLHKITTPTAVVVPANQTHPQCYEAKGTHYVGTTPNCNHTCHVTGDTTPNSKTVGGAWWLCGRNAYLSLPMNWTGVCAPVFLSDHTVLVSLSHATETHLRRKRFSSAPQFKPHDSVWGTDVPTEYKHWSGGTKVVLALFPWVGTAKNTLRLETMDYRFKTFVNLSVAINEGQNKEIDALRLMVLQNRMVLDMLTASQGGVCILLNTTCCTFIPDEVGGHIHEAMDALKNLKNAMDKDRVPQPWDFWSWLTSGPWWHWLLKLLMPVIVVLILFCVFMTCVVPCLRSMVSKTIAGAFSQYQLLQQLDNRDNPDEDETDL